jgi:hypothetical protein
LKSTNLLVPFASNKCSQLLSTRSLQYRPSSDEFLPKLDPGFAVAIRELGNRDLSLRRKEILIQLKIVKVN